MSLPSILRAQITWAGERPRRAHVLDHVEDNLLRAFHPATQEEFATGSGDELGLGGRTAKMRSLRSSSALACNVFDPWRGHELAPLAEALRVTGDFDRLAFEQKVPHGLRGIKPNLDVVLYSVAGGPVGIEAKFTEPYGKKHPRAPLDSKYFVGRRRWAELGMPQVQSLAESIGRTSEFRRLDAGQLVKHALGLANTYRTLGPVRLRYVWFDAQGSEDAEHTEEIQRFASWVAHDIDFAAVTYQTLLHRLAAAPEPVVGYLDYLRARYLAGGRC